MQPAVAPVQPSRPLIVVLSDPPEPEAKRQRGEVDDIFPELEAEYGEAMSSDIAQILSGIRNLETGQNELKQDFKTMAGDIDNLKRHASATDERLRALEENKATASSASTKAPFPGLLPSDSVSNAGNLQSGGSVAGPSQSNPMVLRTVVTVGGFPRGGASRLDLASHSAMADLLKFDLSQTQLTKCLVVVFST